MAVFGKISLNQIKGTSSIVFTTDGGVEITQFDYARQRVTTSVTQSVEIPRSRTSSPPTPFC